MEERRAAHLALVEATRTRRSLKHAQFDATGAGGGDHMATVSRIAAIHTRDVAVELAVHARENLAVAEARRAAAKADGEVRGPLALTDD